MNKAISFKMVTIFILAYLIFPVFLNAKEAKPIDVKIGLNHCLVLKDDGSVWGWGVNDEHQLGPDAPEEPEGIAFIMDHARAIALDHSITYILTEDDILWALGTEFFYGDKAYEDDVANSPRKVLQNVKAIEKSSDIILAVKKDGTLWGWGEKLGSQTPYKIAEDVVETRIGGNGFIFLKEDRSLWIATGFMKLEELGSQGAKLKLKQLGEHIEKFSMHLSTAAFMDRDKQMWIYMDESAFADRMEGSICITDDQKAYTSEEYIKILDDKQPIKIQTDMKDIIDLQACEENLVLTKDGTLWSFYGENLEKKKCLLKGIAEISYYEAMPIVKTKEGKYYFAVWQKGYWDEGYDPQKNEEYSRNWESMKGKEWVEYSGLGDKFFIAEDGIYFINGQGELWYVLDADMQQYLDIPYEKCEGIDLSRFLEDMTCPQSIKVKLMP